MIYNSDIISTVFISIIIGVIIWILVRCQHEWEWKLDDKNECIWLKKCTKCGKEKRTKHNYILQQKNEKCEINQECVNCKHLLLISSNNHVYKDLPLDKNCNIYKVCIDCNTHTYVKTEHSYKEFWANDHGRTMRVFYSSIKLHFKESLLKDLFFYTGINYEETKTMSIDDSIIHLIRTLFKKGQLQDLIIINKHTPLVRNFKIDNITVPDNTYLYFSKKFWNYEDIEASCTIESKCTNCGIKEFRKHHQYIISDFLEPNNCTKYKYCLKCATIDSKIKQHDWGALQYESAGSCKQIRKCERCKEKISEPNDAHQWGELQYKSSTSCQKICHCNRCGIVQEKQIEHIWENLTFERNIGGTLVKVPYKVCSRCGSTDKNLYLL